MQTERSDFPTERSSLPSCPSSSPSTSNPGAGAAVAAPEHEQGHEVVGVAEVVAHPHRHLDLVVDGLYAPVADAELAPGRPAAVVVAVWAASRIR